MFSSKFCLKFKIIVAGICGKDIRIGRKTLHGENGVLENRFQISLIEYFLSVESIDVFNMMSLSEHNSFAGWVRFNLEYFGDGNAWYSSTETDPEKGV